MLGSYTDLKQLIINTNGTLYDNLNDFQTDIQQQFLLVSNQNVMTQAIITSFKIDTTNNLSAITTLINNNQLSVKDNFFQTNSQITSVNTTIITNINQVITDLQSTNINIINNFTHTNAKINSLVTNNQFQTQIDLLKQQIQNISISVGQSMTSAQYRCILLASYFCIGNWDYYLINMQNYGCPIQW
ncbi:Hypothetical_protein [Hexamita inflata]|uniref:Hypothetical_protein n=1 Tax=Hexamita inflata TaxID=28002 RepID=A0AA86TRW5_9EUKA|nr:Hypothetical protein HINF_LOCUS12002 [Hexamita inflata]